MRTRHLATILAFFVMACWMPEGSLNAQQATQRGRIKQIDIEKGLIMITTADGTEVEAAIVSQSMLRDANNQPITNFREQGLPAGAAVQFRIDRRGGRNVLVGLRLPPAGGRPMAKANAPEPPPPRATIGVKPLTELGEGTYKGQTGGLYGNGSNEPPAAQRQAGQKAVTMIRPLDASGRPADNGKIGLVSIGMSNTTQEFSVFVKMSAGDPLKSDKVVVVDLAQGGQIPMRWNDPQSDAGKQVWGVVDRRLKAAELSSQQVQVAWIKQALAQQAQYGDFPEHAKKLENELITSLQVAKQRFPNLQLAYLSSRIYGGYATTALNPEPYAYEGAFAMRWIIDDQVSGDPRLNFDAARGEVKAPVVLWGPYLWADGTTPRKDGLVWNRDDLVDRDGTHPSPSGQKKVAELLLAFFHSDPYARPWYLK